MTIELILVIVLALAFDFVNGFHDCANAIATCVSTRALTPKKAIIMSRTLNFVGALVSTAVAYTIGKGIVDVAMVESHYAMSIVLVGLVGAITWDLITWHFGLPSSSTHALVGGFLGAGLVAIGVKCLVWKGIRKVVLAMIISPVAGLATGLLLVALLMWLFRGAHPQKTTRNFRWGQVLSAGWMSFSHGMNDAQNAMGIITLALVVGGHLEKFSVPLWVKLGCALAMGAGTSIGGWRIIKTMGQKMVDLKPIDGFAAEAGAGAVIVGMSLVGAPISTTHVIACTIMGTGAARRLRAVRWPVVRRILIAWVLTIPGAAIIAAACWYLRLALVSVLS